uniref:3-keto-disaccharide hydrolase n=1 Tax=Halomonas sp. TaxID=1486246 RepID=UPI00260B8C22|nr:DUF1080 domain-containing protein [Halomonas sp.]
MPQSSSLRGFSRLGAACMLLCVSGGTVLASDEPSAQELTPEEQQAAKTEVWEPVPEKVSAEPGQVPSDAIVLFDGTNLDAWEGEEGGAAAWQVEDGAVSVARGQGGIRTKDAFCDMQLHVEWRAPADTQGYDGQDRGNSGIFLQERYEVQVLDSWDNPTYANGQAASVYKQHIPLVNASRAPGEWQSYDIIFTSPRFGTGGELESPAYVSVLHNGVLVQNHVEIQGNTEWIGEPQYTAHDCAPLYLQDHDADVSYRNIWVRPLSGESDSES